MQSMPMDAYANQVGTSREVMEVKWKAMDAKRMDKDGHGCIHSNRNSTITHAIHLPLACSRSILGKHSWHDGQYELEASKIFIHPLFSSMSSVSVHVRPAASSECNAGILTSMHVQ